MHPFINRQCVARTQHIATAGKRFAELKTITVGTINPLNMIVSECPKLICVGYTQTAIVMLLMAVVGTGVMRLADTRAS